MKKIFSLGIVAIMISVLLTGCGSKGNSNELTLSTDEIIEKLYDGIDEENLPKLMKTVINSDNMESYLGVSDLDIEEGSVSEPMMSSIAHSVVVVKLKDGADVEKSKEEIKENANPRKWVCVEAEQVIVENRGSVIILIMSSNDLAPQLKTNFENLK